MCNLVYFGRNPSKYKGMFGWWKRVYGVREVRVVTHMWYSMAKEIVLSVKNV